MQELKAGEYFGTHFFEHDNNGLLLSDMEYTHPEVDWHRHENPYFTFLLAGDLYEENKKESYFLQPGTLVYHNWQDAHKNRKSAEYTRGFHLEFKDEWLQKFQTVCPQTNGKKLVEDPKLKQLMFLLVMECRSGGADRELSLDLLALSILEALHGRIKRDQKSKPGWVSKLNELLLEEPEGPTTASELAKTLGLHPVYFSRIFHSFFGVSYSHYVRQLRLSRASDLILGSQLSLTEIALKSGYFDQSHFIRDFKKAYRMTPKKSSQLFRG